jgi:hypothetical protein
VSIPEVQHIIVLEGTDAALPEPLALLTSFSLMTWLAPPSNVINLDVTAVFAYHLVEGDLSAAYEIAQALNPNLWPFVSAHPSNREIRSYLLSNPSVRHESAEVSSHLRNVGYPSVADWKVHMWGAAHELLSPDIHVLGDALAVVRFTDYVARPHIGNLLQERYPQLEVSGLLVDISKGYQLQFGRNVLREALSEAAIAEHKTWLDVPPPNFIFN